MKARVLTIATILALSGVAAAQSSSLTLGNVPASDSITAGETASYSPDVTLNVSGVDCAQSVDVPVNVTVSTTAQAPPTNASQTPTPGSLTFTVPEGTHRSTGTPADDAAGGWSGTQAGEVSVGTASGVSKDYTVSVSIVASTPGAASDTCTMDIPATESDPATVTLSVAADAPAQEAGETGGSTDGGGSMGGDDGSGDEMQSPPNGDGSGDSGDTDTEESSGIPAPGALVPVAALAAALTYRRKET